MGETVKGYNFTNWWGVLAPQGAPAEAIKRLNDELIVIAAMPEVKDRLRDLGLAAQSNSPQQFGEWIASETEKITRIVKDANIKLE